MTKTSQKSKVKASSCQLGRKVTQSNLIIVKLKLLLLSCFKHLHYNISNWVVHFLLLVLKVCSGFLIKYLVRNCQGHMVRRRIDWYALKIDTFTAESRGRGAHNKILYGEAPPHGPTRSPFIHHFWEKRYLFHIPSIEKWYPFHIPSIENGTPSYTSKATFTELFASVNP